MIVTIDGPAGAGKSYIARALAQRLGFQFLDTGATYRAVALAAMQRDMPWTDAEALADLSAAINIQLADGRVVLDGQDVTDEIRTPAVTEVIHFVADLPEVRENLVQLQRRIAGQQNTVTEGRDQGTVAFPHAQCKIFLTASPEERARRRMHELQERGQPLPLEEVLRQQNERDRRDANRPVGRLYRAPDGVEVCTDGMTRQQVVDRVEELVKQKMTG